MQLACLYQRRMTIEQGFRDLKSGTFGAGFEHSLTRKDSRLSNLLLLFALVQLATWLVGLHEEHQGRGGRLEGKTPACAATTPPCASASKSCADPLVAVAASTPPLPLAPGAWRSTTASDLPAIMKTWGYLRVRWHR
ncbi:MAG: hypothetical protein IPH76_18825 [Xanthomonadales bacterium]|nr:hypothetical protein [Xanthomonadales bacterium]